MKNMGCVPNKQKIEAGGRIYTLEKRALMKANIRKAMADQHISVKKVFMAVSIMILLSGKIWQKSR